MEYTVSQILTHFAVKYSCYKEVGYVKYDTHFEIDLRLFLNPYRGCMCKPGSKIAPYGTTAKKSRN